MQHFHPDQGNEMLYLSFLQLTLVSWGQFRTHWCEQPFQRVLDQDVSISIPFLLGSSAAFFFFLVLHPTHCPVPADWVWGGRHRESFTTGVPDLTPNHGAILLQVLPHSISGLWPLMRLSPRARWEMQNRSTLKLDYSIVTSHTESDIAPAFF